MVKTSTKSKVRNTTEDVEVLHNALLAVHSSQSVTEIETQLHQVLKKSFLVDWVRVFTQSSTYIDEHLQRLPNQIFFVTPLQVGLSFIGKIVFARKTQTDFDRKQKQSLQQLADSVALAIDRLSKLDQAENLKQQWESTFDAIHEPLCLTDEKWNILRTNKAFLNLVGKKQSQVMGLNCFSIFAGQTTHQIQSRATTEPFVIERASKQGARSYEVSTQHIRSKSKNQKILLTIFRDITQQKKIEKQIFESSKMAELGTIGSSIAHDINNPLGGMLNFLQLIKNDLATDNPIREDILQMEQAGLRCKEIVETLLKFSRKQDLGNTERVRLIEVVEHSLKILELQTRSVGINVQFNPPSQDVAVRGNFNLLSQVLSHVLQNAFEAVSEKLTESPGYKGVIHVQIENSESGPYLQIIDNGVGITPELHNKIFNPMFSTKRKNENKGLGLTLAYQIIDEMGGSLEISSQPNVQTRVKISFRDV
jgi:two-component system NtrC family sensor kinase